MAYLFKYLQSIYDLCKTIAIKVKVALQKAINQLKNNKTKGKEMEKIGIFEM